MLAIHASDSSARSLSGDLIIAGEAGLARKPFFVLPFYFFGFFYGLSIVLGCGHGRCASSAIGDCSAFIRANG
jgi:hypothetical protein